MPESVFEELARGALLEITPASTVGALASVVSDDGGATSLLFENEMPGYPGWFWTVSVAAVPDEEPTVLEVELMPGEGALLSPDWVPWSDRLAEYKAAQEAAGLEVELPLADDLDDLDDSDESDDDDSEDDDDDDSDDDDSELDEDDVLGSDVLHGGDLDGVDIDDPDADDDDIDDEGDDRSY